MELAAHGAACVYACSTTPQDQPHDLPAAVNSVHPNTKIIPYPLNPATEEDTLTLIDDILNAWGRLDVWVSSCGLLGPPTLETTAPSDLRKCFEANAMAPFFALKYAPPAMAKTTPRGKYPNAAPKEVEYGSIIVVASVASTYGGEWSCVRSETAAFQSSATHLLRCVSNASAGCWGPCFTMTSHAALGVVRAGVTSLKGTNIRINCISPGQIDVGLSLDMDLGRSQLPPNPADLQSQKAQRDHIALGRAGLPQEVGKVAGFLASGFSSYVTGANMVVDGGATVMSPLTVPI
ncbi:uncharacterized protein J3D65DRAFT_614285 [Phyllosticta citribraziliensis]|uniref:Peroxisomal trans-2-enoyl-CoA reductase n=1 Tax=Phyllosticta citribraziliensis TaxID=989973 RepID=A0ABR1M4Q7_9PEZI